MSTTRRQFLGLMGAVATSRTYFLAPIGGWTSSLIINPNDLPQPALHRISETVEYFGKYHKIAVLDENERVIPYRRSEVQRRSMRNLPPEYTNGRHTIFVGVA